ncbi:MAG: phosphotransferase [Pseudomonadota bacterium]
MAKQLEHDPRLEHARHWLAEMGCPIHEIRPASADASFRRYWRIALAAPWQFGDIELGDGDTMILMDAPPEHENTAQFVKIANACAQAELLAPRVLALRETDGFAILDDLGDTTVLPVLQQTPALAETLYAQAGALLHRWQARIDPIALELPAYDAAFLQTEMDLFRDWLCAQHMDAAFSTADKVEWQRLSEVLIRNAQQQPQVAVHRDFHSRNLMLHNDTLAMIDFQDAMHGPITYDLISLLRDAYIEWPLAQVCEWAMHWFDDCESLQDVSPEQQLRWLLLMGVQRQLKVGGIFARLSIRDGKHQYLADIPRTLSYIVALRGRFPELDWIIDLIERRCLPVLSS